MRAVGSFLAVLMSPKIRGEENMSTDEYNGWTNRETWCAALWINNDQGWQELVDELLRDAIETQRTEDDTDNLSAYQAGEIIRDHFEELAAQVIDEPEMTTRELRSALHDIGSLYRVNWDEIGASFLAAIRETDEFGK